MPQRLRLFLYQRLQGATDLRKGEMDRQIFQCQLNPPCFDGGKVQDVVDEQKQVLAAELNLIDIALLALIQWAATQVGQ